MDTAQVKEIIAQAHASGKTLVILGYQSDKGEIINFEVQILGKDGYRQLVNESLQALKAGKIVKPDHILTEDWNQAATEQRASWEKTVAGAQVVRNYSNELIDWPQGFATQSGQPNLVILRNLRWLVRDEIKPAEQKVVKSAAKTLAKQEIVKQSPLYHYQGQLNLAPGKFTSIRIK